VLCEVVACSVDLIVVVIVGCAGFVLVMVAIECGGTIVLVNKEVLVSDKRLPLKH
jgi:1-deoxy-D-xylulose 5-phosphate reductoisomerase